MLVNPFISFAAAGGGGGLPAGWTEVALSTAVSHPTGSTYDSGGDEWTWRGAGEDIWSNDDRCIYIYNTLSEGQQCDAYVETMVLESGNQAGLEQYAGMYLMLRETLDKNSKHTSVGVNPNNNRIQRKYRSSTNGSTQENNTSPGSPYLPVWFRIVRPGDGTALAYYSQNGTDYTLLGTAFTVGTSDWYIGMAVNSHDDAAPDLMISTGTIAIS